MLMHNFYELIYADNICKYLTTGVALQPILEMEFTFSIFTTNLIRSYFHLLQSGKSWLLITLQFIICLYIPFKIFSLSQYCHTKVSFHRPNCKVRQFRHRNKRQLSRLLECPCFVIFAFVAELRDIFYEINIKIFKRSLILN